MIKFKANDFVYLNGFTIRMNVKGYNEDGLVICTYWSNNYPGPGQFFDHTFTEEQLSKEIQKTNTI